ncbi:hypothetical protein [Flavobacterium aquiphilum]|uniref:hypothetical protein n=1 Tax=Flavobacterium aquiphilum TaxID=3003261 RepID=UPI00248014EA|nr:hypothetical protein [Flavobacterium aquiphilum]
MINNSEIIERVKTLYLSLKFCSEQMRVFTVGERICINQERLQWLHILTNQNAEPRPISNNIETKIKNILGLIHSDKITSALSDPLLNELLTINNFTDVPK